MFSIKGGQPAFICNGPANSMPSAVMYLLRLVLKYTCGVELAVAQEIPRTCIEYILSTTLQKNGMPKRRQDGTLQGINSAPVPCLTACSTCMGDRTKISETWFSP